MATKLVETAETVEQAIPLDLGPLLSPYRRHKNLSVRVEKLPQLSRLSQGRNNGDCTFSLKLDDLAGLLYLPPPGWDGAEVTLAVRIINLDDDYATTLALIDLPVSSASIPEDGIKHTLRVIESNDNTEDEPEDEPSEPAALTAIHVKRNTDVGATVLPAGTDVRQELEAEISQLREQLETSANDVDQTQKQVLEAAEAAMARDFVAQISATKEQLEKGFADRLAEALQEVEEKAEARIEAAEKAAEEKAQKAVQDGHASTLDKQIAAVKKEQEQEFKDQLTKALGKAEEEAEARITALEKKAQEDTKAALADAQKNFDDELTRLRQQQENAVLEASDASNKELEAAKTEYAREIARLQASHVRDLETQSSALAVQLESEFADRLKQALSEAEKGAAEKIAAAEQQAKEAADNATAQIAAIEQAKAEADQTHAEAKQAIESEISELRQKLEKTTTELENAHKNALKESHKTHAEEIATLQKIHASELETQIATHKEQTTASETKLNQEFTKRLETALQEAEEHSASVLAEAQKKWDAQAQTSLLAARETWTSEEAARLGAAKKEFEDELSKLRQQVDADSNEIAETGRQALEDANAAHAKEIADLTEAHKRALEEQAAASRKQLEQEIAEKVAEAQNAREAEANETIETKLAEARAAWEVDAEAALSAARITWRTEEAERLDAAKKDYEGQLAKLRKEGVLVDADIDIDAIRKAAIEEIEAAHAAEIEKLKSAHAKALEAKPSAHKKTGDGDVAEQIAEAVREAEEKTETRIAKARLVWEADAEAKLAKARESWKREEADRLEAAKSTWKGGSGKGPTARERAYREQRNWMPRRSRLLALLAVGLVGFAALHPEVKPLIVAHSTQAYSEVKARIDALIAPKPVVSTPAPSIPAAVQPPSPTPADAAATISGRVIIAVGSANVRAGPSSDAAVIKSLPQGSEASVLGSDKGWQLIRFGEGTGDVGWVYGDLLSAPPTRESNP